MCEWLKPVQSREKKGIPPNMAVVSHVISQLILCREDDVQYL